MNLCYSHIRFCVGYFGIGSPSTIYVILASKVYVAKLSYNFVNVSRTIKINMLRSYSFGSVNRLAMVMAIDTNTTMG